MPDEELGESTTEVADDLCLVASLASRSVVNWHRYTLHGAVDRDYRRALFENDESMREGEGMVFHGGGSELLLPGALDELQRWRELGVELRGPIQTVAHAHRIPVLEQRFTAYFQALEQLKDMFATSRNLEFILGTSAWKRIASSVRKLVRAHPTLDEDVRVALQTKVPELRRRSIRDVLEKMATELDVQFGDLYPAGTQPSFLATRNLLTHTSKDVELEALILEQMRVRTIAERFLFAFLGLPREVRLGGLPPAEWVDRLTQIDQTNETP